MTRFGDESDLDAPAGPFGVVTGGDGRVPKLVVVGVLWALFGVVGLIAAVLLHSAGVAVFGGLSVLAGGALYLGQRARTQFERDETLFPFSPAHDDEPDPDDGAPDDDARGSDRHDGDTRVMSRAGHDDGDEDDDVVDAEYTEHFDYDQSPADQDDGTGYDDESVAYERWRSDQHDREVAERDAAADAADDEQDDEADASAADRADGRDEDEDADDRRTARPDPDAWMVDGRGGRG